MPIDDVILNKAETIRRCILRINEEYIGFEKEFDTNYTKQDSIILNLERASQASVDIATHLVRVSKLGIPKTTRELFVLLEGGGYITSETSSNMQKMVGFRNIAVHDYQNLNIEIVKKIITEKLDDFNVFIVEVKTLKSC